MRNIKFYSFILALFALSFGIGIYLLFSLVHSGTNVDISKFAPTVKAEGGACTYTAALVNGSYTCDVGACTPANFTDSVPAGSQSVELFCKHVTNDPNKDSNHLCHGSSVAVPFDGVVPCDVNNIDCNNPANSGKTGNASQCSNPWACKVQQTTPTQLPTVTPIPTVTQVPLNGSLTVNAICVNTNGDTVQDNRGIVFGITLQDTNSNVLGVQTIHSPQGSVSFGSLNPSSNYKVLGDLSSGAGLNVVNLGCVNSGTITPGSSCTVKLGYCGAVVSPSPSTPPSVTPSTPPSITPSSPAKHPAITIQKILTNGNYLPVGNTTNPPTLMTYSILIKNVGGVDLTGINLTDDFDSRYLQFVPPTNPNVAYTASNDPISHRTTLTFSDLLGSGAALIQGATYTMTLNFESLLPAPVNSNLTTENQNCAVVPTITSMAGNVKVITTENLKSCAPFNTQTPGSITVATTKSYIGAANIAVGQDVNFQAKMTNTSSTAFSDITFTDNFDGGFLTFKSISVIKNGGTVKDLTSSATVTNSSVVLQHLQNLYGSTLNPNDVYTFNIVYTAKTNNTSTSPNTCDTVTSNVVDASGNTASSNATACTNIVAPTPPPTGVSFIASFVIPAITFVASFVTRKYVKMM